MMLMFTDHADLSFYHIYNIWSYVIYIISFASFFCFLFLHRLALSSCCFTTTFGPKTGMDLVSCNEADNIRQHCAKASAGAMSLQYCRDHGRNSLSRFLRKITIDMSNLDAPKWHCSFHCRTLPFNDEFQFRAILVGKSEGYTFRHWRRHQRATRHLQLWTPRTLGYIWMAEPALLHHSFIFSRLKKLNRLNGVNNGFTCFGCVIF